MVMTKAQIESEIERLSVVVGTKPLVFGWADSVSTCPRGHYTNLYLFIGIEPKTNTQVYETCTEFCSWEALKERD